jgi:hypothetical protein
MATTPVRAQSSMNMPMGGDGDGLWARLSGTAVPAYTWVSRIPRGGSLDEFRIVEPIVMLEAGALRDRLRFQGTLDFEGATMPGGELGLGVWGEGFIDRRHPHTYFHELMLSGAAPLPGGLRASLSAGKGFAPFGSDDPMNRPTELFPVNHHWSQILERAVVMAGLAWRPLVLEAGVFNGDEPENPSQWPNMSRFGDSWSVRLLIHPLEGVELQGSHALVKSPEHRPGAGSDNLKWSASARAERPFLGGSGYLFGEYAHNSEFDGFFQFRSWLVEGAWSRGRHRPYYRYENTDRPEEERTIDPFRSPRPHLENSIIGTSRWSVSTIGYGLELGRRDRLSIQPLFEVSYASVQTIGGGIFNADVFYGGHTFWRVTTGVRLSWRMQGHRMGRYGVLAGQVSADPMSHHMN